MVPLFKKPVFWLGAALPVAIFAVLWRVASRRPRLIAGLDSPALALAVSRDGSRVVAATQTGGMRVWTSQNDRFRALPFDRTGQLRTRSAGDSVTQLRLLPDEKTVFAASSRHEGTNGMGRAWSIQNSEISWAAVPNGKDDFSRFWLSDDGTRLVQRTWTWIKVFDVTKPSTPRQSQLSRSARNFSLIRRFDFHNSTTPMPQEFALSRDNKTVVVLGWSGRLEFWDVKTAKRTFQTPPALPALPGGGGARSLSLSPDGRFIALCDTAGMRLWNTLTSGWQQVGNYSSNERNIVWASDSRSLWTGGDTAQQWSAPDLKLLRTVPVSGPVAVSSDGQTLVTRSIPRAGEGSGVWQWNMS